MKSKIYLIKTGIIMVVIALQLSGCKNQTSSEPTTNAPETQLEVDKIIALGRVEPEAKITPIGSEVGGTVQKILVKEGDSVKAGKVLVELAHSFETAKLAAASTKLATQQASIKTLEAQLASAKIKALNLTEKVERLKRMVAQGAETKQSLDNTSTDLAQAEKDVDRILSSIKEGEARIKEINADIALSATDVERRIIKAPADGVVLTVNVTEGSAINLQSGQPLLDFAPQSAITVVCEVDELFAMKVKTGQQVFIRTPGVNDTLGTGTVVFVSPTLKRKSLFSDDTSNMEDRRVREVRVKLNPDAAVLINSRVEAVISLE